VRGASDDVSGSHQFQSPEGDVGHCRISLWISRSTMDAASTDWTAHPRPPDRLHLTEHRRKTFSLYYLRDAHDFFRTLCVWL